MGNDCCRGGSIFIEFEGNRVSFASGSVIKGTVHVKYTQPYPAKDLRIRLYGYENCWVERIKTDDITHKSHFETYYAREDIINFS
jgi:hypothetical protein